MTKDMNQRTNRQKVCMADWCSVSCGCSLRAIKEKEIGLVLDSFASARAATHMEKCVRTSNVTTPHHQAVSPRGHNRQTIDSRQQKAEGESKGV